jgi:hypothetical protein
MAVVHNLVALNSSTAVAIDTATYTTNTVTGETRPNWQEANLYIQNVDASATVYIGGSTVTSSSYGYKLTAGSSINIRFVGAEDTIYAISSGSSNVAVLMVRQ